MAEQIEDNESAAIADREADREAGRELRSGWLRGLGIAVAMLALGLIALWTQRAPIAENFINRELNRRGVEAQYDVAQIGLRTQRIENVVLGDPDDPDLTARSVEVDLAFGGITPEISAVRGEGVRIRGRLHEGALELGELDKFRDPSSKAPFSLPDFILGLKDARMRLDTDFGPIGMRIDGSGPLRSGFRGRVAAVMPNAAVAGCGIERVTALLSVATQAERPRLSGPLQAEAFGCEGNGLALARPVADIDVTLGKALDRWTGQLGLRAQALKSSGVVLVQPEGTIGFDGNARRTAGRMRIESRIFSLPGAEAERARVAGAWSADQSGALDARLQGSIGADNVRMTGRDPLAGAKAASAGTPVAPLVARLVDAVANAGRANSLRSQFALVQRGGVGSLALTDTRLSARSGAVVALSPQSHVALSWPGRAQAAIDWTLDGSLTTDGGGLPRGALRLARRPGGGLGGQLFVDPYSAGGARLALDTVRFTSGPRGETHFTTQVSLDGPLPDGALRGLVLPVDGVIGGDGSVLVNPRCAPLSLASAAYGGFALGRTQMTLCPVEGGGLIAYDRSGLRGGAEVRGLALTGASGSSPMRLAADRARVTLGKPGFALAGATIAIGPQDAPVLLRAATLDGQSAGGGLGGRITGASGQIGTVPLLIEQAEGRWGFAAGTLKLNASLTVKDRADVPRFNPVESRDFTLTMRDGRIVARGALVAPRNGGLVATADIVHELGSGNGHADLSVPGLIFDTGLQPEHVTDLAKGVVANVAATVTGEGHIRWKGGTVSSDGRFATANASLAAAFGPVSGLTGEIRFTDLLGLVSAPGQEVRIASTNPGVEVRDGMVRFQLQPNVHVRIEGGEWPFSGGQLVLLPTTLNFADESERYMTFRVVGLDAGAFIQAMELDNISATGTFDGIMPLIFNKEGGRITGGVLVARQQGMPPLLMPEGVLPTIPCDPARQSGTLSYVGPVSNEQLGVMGKLAFDALKNLQYKCLTILMDGALDGEMVTNVVFNGVNRGIPGQAPGAIARNFVGLPFLFNVRVEAPFRGLLGAAQSFVDPSALIRNSLGDQYQQKLRDGVAVQPSESEKKVDGERK